MKEEKEIKEFVKKRYGEYASRMGCCDRSTVIKGEKKTLGYSKVEISTVPQESAMLGAGCGNPTALAKIMEGETVLDLGSGGGIDVFLAAEKVGEKGKAIGVDMTVEMIEKARENAKKGNYKNVEFRLGEIESLPIDDESIDVIISNCVINLSPDKLATFKEAYRVLKPNGRMLISDLVTEGELPIEIKKSFDAWAGCIAGAMERNEYLNTMKKAGFKDIEIVKEHPFSEVGMNNRLRGKIISVQVKAYKLKN